MSTLSSRRQHEKRIQWKPDEFLRQKRRARAVDNTCGCGFKFTLNWHNLKSVKPKNWVEIRHSSLHHRRKWEISFFWSLLWLWIWQILDKIIITIELRVICLERGATKLLDRAFGRCATTGRWTIRWSIINQRGLLDSLSAEMWQLRQLPVTYFTHLVLSFDWKISIFSAIN